MPDNEALTTGAQTAVSNLTANGWQGALKLVILAVVLFIICMIICAVDGKISLREKLWIKQLIKD